MMHAFPHNFFFFFLSRLCCYRLCRQPQKQPYRCQWSSPWWACFQRRYFCFCRYSFYLWGYVGYAVWICYKHLLDIWTKTKRCPSEDTSFITGYYNFCFLHSCCFISLIGLRPGDEIVVLNGCEVSSLDLALIQTLFSDQSLQLTVKRHPPSIRHNSDTANTQSLHRDNLQNHQRAKSSTGTEDIYVLHMFQFLCQHIYVFWHSEFNAQ